MGTASIYTSRRAIGAALAGMFAVVAFGGCTSTATAPAPSSSVSDVGVSPADTESLAGTLAPIVEREMAALQVPGVLVYVSTPGQGEWRAALGVSDTSTGTPMDVMDHMRIGSITKTFTATVVLQLAQEGKLSLDAPLSDYLPQEATNGATIRQALQMTSGIATYTTLPFLNGLAAAPERVWTPQELVSLGTSSAPSFPAGTGIEYSNTNYILLGQLLEQVTGQSYEALLQERIFDPLSLTGCTMPAPTDASMPAPYSHGYMLGTQWDRAPAPPGSLPQLLDVTDWNPSWGWSAGGAICDLHSVRTWTIALAEGTLLSPQTQSERLAWQTFNEEPLIQYGLGIGNWDGFVGHNGELPGYQSKALYRVADGATIVVLANLTSSPDLQGPAEVITDAIIQALPEP